MVSGALLGLLVALPAPAMAGGGPAVVTLERDGDAVMVSTQRTASQEQARDVMAREAADPDTLAVELDSPVHALADPVQQWGVESVAAAGAWQRTTGSGVVVAVVDTGVDARHEDLAGRVLPGRDFTTRSIAPADSDPNGHGTHLAGIVGATAGNGLGGSGVAPGATILPVRVLDASGAGYSSQVAAGIIWAADNGADIINLSLGGPTPSRVQAEAISYAVSQGVLVVAAAGNGHSATGVDVPQYPAALPDVLGVGAVTPTGEPATFSTRGDYIDLAAPGTMITSTVPGNGYAAYSGTSMAAPFVSGVAALLESLQPLSPAELTSLLTSTATDVFEPGPDLATGAGVVSAVNAVEALAGPVVASAPPKASSLAPIRAARETLRVRAGKRVVVRFPQVHGDSYSWSVRLPGGDWQALATTAPTLRTPHLRKAVNGIRFKVLAAAARPVYAVVRIKVIR